MDESLMALQENSRFDDTFFD
jgi:hypothetical protein